MYNLPYFKANNHGEVIEFMHQHPFIILSGVDADNKPVATHVPILFEEKEDKLFFVGHIMKQTDHHKAFEKNDNVLAIFTGPHTYVSASWYSNQKQASTWNYLTVHAKGKLNFLGEGQLLSILKRTTEKFENNPASPSAFEKLPADYVQKLAKAIVAFEIEVIDIDDVFKLSQNRDKQSHENIREKLKQGDADSQQIAELMRSHNNELINDED